MARIEFEKIDSDEERQEIVRLVAKQNQSELNRLSIYSNKNSDLDISKEMIYSIHNLVKFGNTFAEEQSILVENDRNWRLIRQVEQERFKLKLLTEQFSTDSQLGSLDYG